MRVIYVTRNFINNVIPFCQRRGFCTYVLHFYMPSYIYVSFLIIIHTYCHVGCCNLLN